MKDVIFLAVPSYVFATDLLRTKYLEYLGSKYRVVVLTPFLSWGDVVGRRYYQSTDVVYVQRKLDNPKFWSLFKFLRTSCVNEFDYLDSIRYWYLRPNYKNNWKRRLVRSLSRPFSRILTASFFTKLEALLLSRSPSFDQLVREYHPVLVVTATVGFDAWEAEIILLSNKANILTVAIDFSWDNLTMNSKHIRKTDYLVAWNEIMKKEAVDIHGYSHDRVFVSGTLKFDPYFYGVDPLTSREQFLKLKGLNPDNKTILYTTVTRAYPFQKKYIRNLIELRSNNKIPYVNILIRIHPRDDYENYREFSDVHGCCVERSGKVDGCAEMDYADIINLKNSIQYSDLNINYASTISIEACVFDKPIINVGFIDRFALAYDFNHYRPIYKSGAVRLAKTDDELASLINTYLEKPALDREARDRIVREYVGFTDGLSYKRSVEALEKILS